MVPLAIGTQTNGSVIRPASFCGVVGYKPTAGRISRRGVLQQSPTFDQLGVFARSVEDAALLAQCLAGQDADDPSSPAPAPLPAADADAESPRAPAIGFVRTPMWDRVTPEAQAALLQLASSLGAPVPDVVLPDNAAGVLDLHRELMEADIARSFADEYARGREQLSASLCAQIERGRRVGAGDYRRAIERRAMISEAFDAVFDRFDVLLTPAALGTAPLGLEATGDPVMCTLWSFTGQPAITLPLLHGANGLPLGVQLVGRRGGDAALLRAARWLSRAAATNL
jgi:Asp-tRNA(Asn)/Glu-tRNA(Gln) amidotransferase A subunit family amidase